VALHVLLEGLDPGGPGLGLGFGLGGRGLFRGAGLRGGRGRGLPGGHGSSLGF